MILLLLFVLFCSSLRLFCYIRLGLQSQGINLIGIFVVVILGII